MTTLTTTTPARGTEEAGINSIEESHMASHKQLIKVLKPDEVYSLGKNATDTFGSDCSCGCKYFHALEGKEGADWGVCTQPRSPRAGLLTFEHMGCQFFKYDKSLDEDLGV